MRRLNQKKMPVRKPMQTTVFDWHSGEDGAEEEQ